MDSWGELPRIAQWKNLKFVLLFSMYALKDVLPNQRLRYWQSFVLACGLLCNASPVSQNIFDSCWFETAAFCQGIWEGKWWIGCNTKYEPPLASKAWFSLVTQAWAQVTYADSVASWSFVPIVRTKELLRLRMSFVLMLCVSSEN